MQDTKVTNILKAKILPITQKELLKTFNKGVLFTPNVDHLIKLENDKEFEECYNSADWVICDSQILYFCSKFLPNKIPEAIPGSSFFSAFYNYHKNDPECRIFLLGAKDGVASIAMDRINHKLNRRIIVGAFSPSLNFENNSKENNLIYQQINDSKANVVVVGLGAPKQEKWIIKNKVNMPDVKAWMALGAAIDFEAGTLKRAPLFLRKLGLEWLFRFMCEPTRLFRRYFIEDLRFFKLFIQKHILTVNYYDKYGT